MYANSYESSLETRVLSATPLELVNILFDAVVSAVADARRHLAAGRIHERSRSVTKAVEILAELAHSLDHAKGGDLSTRLGALYDYISRRLLDANYDQADAGLAEAESLLRTVREGWAAAAAQQVVAAGASRLASSGMRQWSA